MLGLGTLDYPYIIEDVNDLQDMANDLAAYYKLGNDIDASATVGWNGGAGFVPVGTFINPFAGSFNGQEYEISDLFIDRPGIDEIGLFGYVDAATIRNVSLSNVDITGDDNIGGLIGWAEDSTISNCSTTGTVSGDDWVGGLVGYSHSCNISDVFSFATVTGTDDYSGGLIGYSADYSVLRSYATGNVTGVDDYVGGLFGYSSTAEVTDCFARGNATGDNNVGGLIGYISSGIVENCFSTGLVTGNTNVGGLIGDNHGTVNDSFWDTQTSGQAASDGGTGKTTSQMKAKSTFISAGWDFIVIWFINGITNDGYPFFFEMPPDPLPDSPRATVAVEDNITLKCIRNIEMAAGGRFHIDEEGNAVYKSRYARNL